MDARVTCAHLWVVGGGEELGDWWVASKGILILSVMFLISYK
jgi:hypothetical protein